MVFTSPAFIPIFSGGAWGGFDNVIMPPLRGYFLATAWRNIFEEGYPTKQHKDHTKFHKEIQENQHQRCGNLVEDIHIPISSLIFPALTIALLSLSDELFPSPN